MHEDQTSFFLKRANIFQGQNPRALAEAVESAEGERWSWQGEGQISTEPESIPALRPWRGKLQVRQVSLPFISFSASTDIGFRAVTNTRTGGKMISEFFLNPFSNAE